MRGHESNKLEDGAVLSVPAGVDAGLLLLVSIATDRVAFHPRHVVNLARGARLTLLELSLGDGLYLHNPVFEVQVDEGAVLTNVRGCRTRRGGVSSFDALCRDRRAWHLWQLRAEPWCPHCPHRGAYPVRGPKGMAHLNGAQLLGGTQHCRLHYG